MNATIFIFREKEKIRFASLKLKVDNLIKLFFFFLYTDIWVVVVVIVVKSSLLLLLLLL